MRSARKDAARGLQQLHKGRMGIEFLPADFPFFDQLCRDSGIVCRIDIEIFLIRVCHDGFPLEKL